MLSRTADNLYWLARYVERAEYLARILDTTLPAHGAAARLCRRHQRMGIRGRHRRLRQRLLRDLRGGERGDRHRIPRLLDQQSVLDPQLLRDRPHQCALGAHGADHRDVGHHQQRLARTQEMGQRAAFARGVRPLPALGAGILAALRRLGLPHHAAQRRLLVLAARRLSSSAPTTPRAFSTSNITCCCRRTRRSAARSIISNGRRSCARCRRSPPITGSTARTSSRGSSPTC